MGAVSLGIANYDLGDRNLAQARDLVQLGERRWVRGKSATLKLVPLDYQLGLDEQFVQESEGSWIPQQRS